MVFFHIFSCIYYFTCSLTAKILTWTAGKQEEKLVKCVSLLWHNAWYLLSPFLQSITLQVVLGEVLKEFYYMFCKALKFIAYDPLFQLVLLHPLLKHSFNSQEEKVEYFVFYSKSICSVNKMADWRSFYCIFLYQNDVENMRM